MKLLDKKRAFITGGSRGIGAEIALIFAENGAETGFSFQKNGAAAAEALARLDVFGKKNRAFRCDVSRPDEVERTMAEFLETFGGIDILVNNAGITDDCLLGEMPLENWEKVIATNLTAAFLHTRAALKTMVAQRHGTIVNISSVVGLRGNAGQANYAASKAGLIGLTQSIAREAGGRGIRCNAIAPGIIETEMTEKTRPGPDFLKKNIDLRRTGTAREVAEAALFLASDRSSYVTGQVLSVCGGFHL